MTDTVRELLEQRIDGDVQAVVWHKNRESTYYGVVSSIRENATVGITTVILDLDDETLRIHSKNSMWLPAEGETLGAVIRSLARTTSAVAGSIDDDEEPLAESLIDFDADAIHSYELVDDYEPGETDGDWKETGGREERYTVHERLEESPIENPDRLIRLEFTGKAPWEAQPQRVMLPPEEIGANYGVEAQADDDLVIVDVDDVDEAPLEELREFGTLGCRSPHGGEHFYLHVPGWKEAFAEWFGVENPHPSWGEVRAGDGYVVGPGSILDDCKHGCCTEDDPGRYELVDEPIATVDAEELAEEFLAPYREVIK